ncbi:hypothetical protein CICLE_v10012231mg [Citrus x clementina]|uniref:rRNA methyltransferase YlbH n=1 Tax=Citrus clementina TaxID=85681 RepID=V4SYZ1_CITCL|nr:uncharacterized protein LOC18039510 isoform X1 [Citrus x clementina]ESR44280.1 hypothetical protein CICLE_v10012231mg [Citrus x clementina]
MSVVSSSPILSPSSGRFSSNSSTNLPLFSTSFTKPISQKRYPLIVFSYKSGTGLTSEDKKELLKRYGLDPDEFLSEPSPKTRRRKEGRGSKLVVSDEKSQEERTTHRLLQVLGGKARRKKLLSPKGMDVRPMMEVVKGAAFDILQSAGGCPASLRPGRWLDLYSGTGSVGIEAISRGCSEVHFVEMDPWVVSNVLTPNLEWTGFLDVSSIHTVRVETFLERAEQFVGKDGPFDYMSVTPPYTAVDYEVLMAQISKSALVGKDSFIVVEYPLRTDMLDTCGCLVKIKDRRFGRTHLAIYGPDWAQKKRKSEKKIPIVT